MVLKNSFNFVNEFLNLVSEQVRKIYLNSKYYNNKISQIDEKNLDYKPSQNLFNCIFKYEKKREKIENYYINSIWTNEIGNYKDYKKLHSFFWLFTLDLKSSKRATQSIILNWIESNSNYNPKNWEMNILSKRLISWISNSKLTYEDSNIEYKKNLTLL